VGLSKIGRFRRRYRSMVVDQSWAAALDAQRNKTDKNDARVLAHLVRSGWHRPVHVKGEESHSFAYCSDTVVH
jgi:transposase